MSDGGESNNKGQRLNSQFPTTFDIKDEKLRKYVNGLRVTKRLQDQRITEQDQQITELEAELQNCKRKQAELAKPEKEQQQKLLAEREKQLSEQNLLIAELKEKLAEQEKTIAQHEENKEIYKCQMASIKSFIDGKHIINSINKNTNIC
jgi:chromosome segregation ATPase